MPRWVSSIPARLTAAAVALGCTASSRAEPMVDINSAIVAAGQQTRAVIARLNDLHASHAGGAPNGGIRTERFRLELGVALRMKADLWFCSAFIAGLRLGLYENAPRVDR